MKTLFSILIAINTLLINAQVYPSFGSEIDVSINGLNFDAMEPFISANGNYLFFNNLNDGDSTKLFYATKVNDSTFNFVGELNGANQLAPPHLDAVADMDASNKFYWTSTRNYPIELDNLFYGNFNSGNVTDIGRVHGNFNKNIPGWLVMDHGISYDGQLLYYNNARLDQNNCQGPCETELGIAQKVNDSTFNKISNSNTILQSINDTNFIYYAPCISSDNLELYYTRYPRDSITINTLFEICVAVRSSPTHNFSTPFVLFSETIANLIEAPTLTTDKQTIYYHRKIPGSHKIVMRYREYPLTIETKQKKSINIYPNPTTGQINIQTNQSNQGISVSIFTLLGKKVMTTTNQTELDINALSTGTYIIKFEVDGQVEIQKLIKTD